MKASELIKHLETVIKIDGDLPVKLIKNTESSIIETVDLAGISTSMGDDDKPVDFLFCDEDTHDAFSG